MKTAQNTVPELRFPEFEGEWGEEELIALANKPLSNGVFNDPNLVGSGYCLINVKDMYSGDAVLIENLSKVDIAEKEFNANKAEYGDVFFTRSSLVKEGIAWSNVLLERSENITYDGHLIKLSPDLHKIDPVFFSKLLRTEGMRKKFVARGKTGTMTTISQSDIANVLVSFPEIQEQQKIASFLTRIDGKLTKLRRKRELLNDYKRGLMQQLFSQTIRFKQDDGSEFPEWENHLLGKVCDVRDGTHESPNYQESGYPLITSKNLMKNGTLSFDNVEYISEKDFIDVNRRSNVEVGDILFGMIGTLGNPVRVQSCDFAIKNVALIKEVSNLQNSFLIYFLNGNYIKKQFHEQNTGGTQKFIALGVIRNLKILLPNIEEQQKIADCLSSFDAKIDAVAKQIQQLDTFKKGLLQKMFV